MACERCEEQAQWAVGAVRFRYCGCVPTPGCVKRTAVGQMGGTADATRTGERMDAVRALYMGANAVIDASPEWTVSKIFRRRWADQLNVYLDWFGRYRMSQHARRDPSIAQMVETFLTELRMWKSQAEGEGLQFPPEDAPLGPVGPRRRERPGDDEAMWSTGAVDTSFYGENWDQRGRQKPGRALTPGITLPHPWARYEAIPWTPGHTRRMPPSGPTRWNPGYLPPSEQRRIVVVGQAGMLHDPILWSPSETGTRMDLVNSEYENLERDVRAMPLAWRQTNIAWKRGWTRQLDSWNAWYRANRRTIYSPVTGLLGLGQDPAVVTPATANRYLRQLRGYRASFRGREGRLTTPEPPQPPAETTASDWMSDIGDTAKALAILVVIGMIAMAVLK